MNGGGEDPRDRSLRRRVSIRRPARRFASNRRPARALLGIFLPLLSPLGLPLGAGTRAPHFARGAPPACARAARSQDRHASPAADKPAHPPPLPPGFESLGRGPRGFFQARGERDGSVLVWIPPGPCLIGSTTEEIARTARVWAYAPSLLRNELPEHEVEVGGFWIQDTEVTNTRYSRFLRAARARGGHLSTCPPEEPEGHDHRPEWWSDDRAPAGYDDHPVTGVDWWDARAYAAWAGLRLPHEKEWEKAARWDEAQHHARRYPWGDCWRRAAARTACEIAGKDLTQLDWKVWWDTFPYTPFHPPTRPAGTYGEGVSPYGIHDMTGNVWEWCEEEYDARRWAREAGTLPAASTRRERPARAAGEAPDREDESPAGGQGSAEDTPPPDTPAPRKVLRAVRGGSWIDTGAVRAATRAARPQNARGGVLGFRCVLPGGAPPSAEKP